MNKLNFAISYLLLCFLFISCSHNSNPIETKESPDYLGSVGTKRTYKITGSLFKYGTSEPYYFVPDSLVSKLSIDTTQLKNGVCSIVTYTETISQISDIYYTSWNLPAPRNSYIQVGGFQTFVYDLPNEIESLKAGKKYLPSGWASMGDIIYLNTVDALMTVSGSTTCPSVPYIKNIMKIGDSWIRYKWIDTSALKMGIETIAQVVGLETVTVLSGTFSAYKIHLVTYHYNPNYSIDYGYEYYVPNVGLVLKELDEEAEQWDSSTNVTSYFHRIVKRELVSVEYVK